MFTPSLEGASRSEGVKDVTHSLEGCDLLLIAPLTYNCNIIGAFKNGTHPTSPRLGFGCQVELRNLTYNAILSVRSKSERTLRSHYNC